MRINSSGIVLVLGVSGVSWSAPIAADENLPSAKWGAYVAPTAYRFASGPAFDDASSGTSLEFGLLYAHRVSATVGFGVEVRTAERRIVSTPQPDLPVGVAEEFVEVPILVSFGRAVTQRDIRITFAGGLSYAVLLSQDLAAQPGASLPPGTAVELGFGDYQRVSWLADAGIELAIDDRTWTFARFRFQQDFDVFGESDDVWIAREYVAYGFSGGLLWSF